MLVVYGLGLFRVYQDDLLIESWDSFKARSIFKYLVVHRNTAVLKDILMDLFWPDADPQAARRNLHQAVYSLRRTLRQGQPASGHIRFEHDCYSLDPALDLWVDWEEFESRVRAGHKLETGGQIEEAMRQYGIAESLYQGDFLEEDVYEDWTSGMCERLRRTYCDIAQRLSEYHLQKTEYHAAIALCQKILARDNCCEQAHRCLMRCYLAQGQRHLAVRQYQACAAVLQEDLDLVPSGETVALYQRIITAL
jgi:DNA-binding SARP family transcriptional activator